MSRGVINLSYGLLSFVLLREWRLESIFLRSQHSCFLPVEESTDSGENPPPPAFSWYCMSRIKAQCIFSTNVFFLHSDAMVPISHFVFFSWFALVSNVLSDVGELDTTVSWSWWSPQILADQCLFFGSSFPGLSNALAILQASSQLQQEAQWSVDWSWLRCSSQAYFHNQGVPCKERNSSFISYQLPLLSKNLWFFNDSGGKKV